MRRPIHWWLMVPLCLIVVSPALRAQVQIPNIFSAPTTPAEKKPESDEARLQQWLKDAKADLAAFNEPGAEDTLPPGIDSAALADRRRDLEQMVLGIGTHLKAVAAAQEAGNELESAREAANSWKGFEEKPPYSMLLLDDLLNQRDAVREKANSYASSIALFNKALTGIHEEARSADEVLRSISTEETGTVESVKWHREAMGVKSRLLAVRASALQTNIARTEIQAAAAAVELSLLERKVRIVSASAKLTGDDLAKVGKAVEERRAALDKEINATRQRQQAAINTRNKLQAALEQAPETDAELPKFKVEAAVARVESLQFVVESLETLQQLESFIPEAYRFRKDLIEAPSKTKRDAALQSMRAVHDRLGAWQVFVANQISAVNADISNQESRVSSIAADDPRLPSVNDRRAGLWERQAVLQRVSRWTESQSRVVSRWLADFETSADKSWKMSFSEITTLVWDRLKWLWNFEVFHYQDIEIMDGLTSTQTKGVPLGMILKGIAFFVFSYFIATRISRRLESAVVGRGHIAGPQARTLRNWLMLAVGFLLATATLHFLSIPLTVFAFLGGALAIGLGFGTQTLIKNFICGIIVLFERKIRVGDVLTVQGTSGMVTEINTRSSVIRNGDGIETLIPNSIFLENQVTNQTLSNRRVRKSLRLGVAHGSSPAAVSEILKDCADRHGLILKEPAPLVTFEDFTDNALIFAIYYWLELDKSDSTVVASDLRFMIEKRFAEAKIALPSSRQDLHIDAETPIKIEWPQRPEE